MNSTNEKKSILCIYHLRRDALLELNPQNIFEDLGYRVEIAHSYTHALSHVESCRFDYVLTDLCLQRVDKPGVALTECGPVLRNFLNPEHVKGFGLFIPPEHSEIGFQKTEPSYITYVASNQCWTVCGNHDWQKLFEKILHRQVTDPFLDRYQEHCIPGNT
jgi:hypothetical protein